MSKLIILNSIMLLFFAPFLVNPSVAFTFGSYRAGSLLDYSTKKVFRSRDSHLSMIFGPPKDDGKPGDYVCKVCVRKCNHKLLAEHSSIYVRSSLFCPLSFFHGLSLGLWLYFYLGTGGMDEAT
jgi:hypothetical protein